MAKTELEALKAELEATKSGLVETETKLEKASKVIAEKDAELETVKTELEATKAVNESLNAEVEKLSATPAIAANPKDSLGFECDGKKYKFNFHAMIYKGSKISSEDVIASEALQADLVKLGSGMIEVQE